MVDAIYLFPLAWTDLSGNLQVFCWLASGILQGCPTSGALWALCFDPLVRAMIDAVPMGRVFAFADDVLILLNLTSEQCALPAAQFCLLGLLFSKQLLKVLSPIGA